MGLDVGSGLGDTRTVSGGVREMRVHVCQGSCLPGLSGLFRAAPRSGPAIAARRRQVERDAGHRAGETHARGTRHGIVPMVRVVDFDPSTFLDSDEVVAEYLTAALEDPNPEV